MSQLLDSIQAIDSSFIQGFVKGCRESGMPDQDILAGIQKAAGLFPQIRKEFEKDAAGRALFGIPLGGIENMLQGAKNVAKATPEVVPPAGVIRQAPKVVPQVPRVTPAVDPAAVTPVVKTKLVSPSMAPTVVPPQGVPAAGGFKPSVTPKVTPAVSAPNLTVPKTPTPVPANQEFLHAQNAWMAKRPLRYSDPNSPMNPEFVNAKGRELDMLGARYNQEYNQWLQDAPKPASGPTPLRDSDFIQSGVQSGVKPKPTPKPNQDMVDPEFLHAQNAWRAKKPLRYSDPESPMHSAFQQAQGKELDMLGARYNQEYNQWLKDAPRPGNINPQYLENALPVDGLKPNYLRDLVQTTRGGATSGAVGGALMGAGSAMNDHANNPDWKNTSQLGQWGDFLGRTALGGLGGAGAGGLSGSMVRSKALSGLAGGIGGSFMANQVPGMVSSMLSSPKAQGGEVPATNTPKFQLTPQMAQAADKLKSDPAYMAQMGKSLRALEQEIGQSMQNGGTADPAKVQQYMEWRAMHTAIQNGQDPAEFMANVHENYQKVMEGGFDAKDFAQMVQTPEGKKLAESMAQKMQEAGQPVTGEGIVDYAKNLFQSHPEQFMALMLGIPLSIMGIGMMMNGNTGMGGILSMLGMGASAYGLGAMGGQNVWQDMWGGMTGKPQSPPGEQAHTNFSYAYNNPVSAYHELVDRSKDDPRMKPFLQYINDPAEFDTFLHAYQQDPVGARRYLQGEINKGNPNTPDWLRQLPQQQWDALQAYMNQPYAAR